MGEEGRDKVSDADQRLAEELRDGRRWWLQQHPPPWTYSTRCTWHPPQHAPHSYPGGTPLLSWRHPIHPLVAPHSVYQLAVGDPRRCSAAAAALVACTGPLVGHRLRESGQAALHWLQPMHLEPLRQLLQWRTPTSAPMFEAAEGAAAATGLLDGLLGLLAGCLGQESTVHLVLEAGLEQLPVQLMMQVRWGTAACKWGSALARACACA